jgi:hypothetical protein
VTTTTALPGTITEPPRAFVERFRALEQGRGLPPADLQLLAWWDGRALFTISVLVDKRWCQRSVATGESRLQRAADAVFHATRDA